MSKNFYDIAIIGGGIIGMATALELSYLKSISIIVIEAEKRLASHQSGNNSGVIHSGLYYKPGSLKAINCTRGRKKLYSFCEKNNIPYERCGKLVVAVNEDEIPYLETLYQRGKKNGLKGIKILNSNEIKKYESNVKGIKGLLVQETGIVDFNVVTDKFGEIFKNNGGEIKFNSRIIDIQKNKSNIILKTTKDNIICKNMINCAGLYSDVIAKMSGIDPGTKIIPFRGEYYEIKGKSRSLFNNLIYPVPDPRFPFLGVHFTRLISGKKEAGPNAVLALKREGYNKLSISIKDSISFLTYKGFWNIVSKNWKMGIKEMYRSFRKNAFTKELQKMIPAIKKADLTRGGSGVRAQSVTPKGELVDDFLIKQAKNMIHVLNAPSPAATASINIGKTIADTAKKNFLL